ncbi:FUSC family protein [Shewanella sp. TC10]|uniref:FUSC family protein n=1 Tax=Shewanella sp. TC10 TaxID=1419739 RepID=UPI00129D9618|nr:FUSC family protein [Shewanella sp. TC10]
MLGIATKEAIKVALAFTSAIVLALLFGWEKPYWAAITVVTLAANESYSHSIQTAQNRIMGTLVGASLAIGMIAFLAQERMLFIGTFILLAGICTLMSYDRKHGYFFRITFIVCTLICFMGSFDDITSVNMIFLRLQETLLGVTVFSLVFRFVWPINSEVNFYTQHKSITAQLTELVAELTECLNGKKEVSIDGLLAHQANLAKMTESIKSQSLILDLPSAGSYQLSHQRKQWKLLTIASYETIERLTQWLEQAKSIVDNTEADPEAIKVSLLQAVSSEDSLIQLNDQLMQIESMLTRIQVAKDYLLSTSTRIDKNSRNFTDIKVTLTWKELVKQWDNAIPLPQRFKDSLIVMASLATSFALWIYTPLPNGYMFPMLSAVMAINLIALPKFIVNEALVGICIFGTLVTLQYVFLMPSFTEVWQLAMFYFINVVVIWRLCAAPQLALQKVVGANLLVVLTMSALHLTPSFDITASLNMLVEVFMAIAVIRFFVGVFKEG